MKTNVSLRDEVLNMTTAVRYATALTIVIALTPLPPAWLSNHCPPFLKRVRRMLRVVLMAWSALFVLCPVKKQEIEQNSNSDYVKNDE